MKSLLRSIKWILLTQAIFCIASSEEDVFHEEEFDFKSSNDFTFENIPKGQYITIEVAGSKENINYVISAYKSSSKDPRIQLAQSFNNCRMF